MFKEPELKWYVYHHNINGRKMEMYDVFRHGGFRSDVMKYTKECKSLKVFSKRVRDSARYYFWSKSEHEIIITTWPPYIDREELNRLNRDFKKDHKCEQVGVEIASKIDIYDQLMLNWNAFINYTWKNKKNLINYYDYIELDKSRLREIVNTSFIGDITHIDIASLRIMQDANELNKKTISMHPDLVTMFFLDSSTYNAYLFEDIKSAKKSVYCGQFEFDKLDEAQKKAYPKLKGKVFKVKSDELLYPGMIKLGNKYIRIDFEERI